MTISDVVKHMILAVKAANNNEPDLLNIIDSVALEMGHLYPASEDDNDEFTVFKVWNKDSYEEYLKLTPDQRIAYFKQNGPYFQYLSSKKANNGVSNQLEQELKMANINQSTKQIDKATAILGVSIATLAIYLLLSNK